jgi:hypothetical protein
LVGKARDWIAAHRVSRCSSWSAISQTLPSAWANSLRALKNLVCRSALAASHLDPYQCQPSKRGHTNRPLWREGEKGPFACTIMPPGSAGVARAGAPFGGKPAAYWVDHRRRVKLGTGLLPDAYARPRTRFYLLSTDLLESSFGRNLVDQEPDPLVRIRINRRGRDGRCSVPCP